MENYHLKKKQQNRRKTLRCPATQVGQQKPKVGSTLQRKVGTKNEITLSREAYKALVMVFNNYGIKKPGWLRQRFYINQQRRKLLRGILHDTPCDATACNTVDPADGWSWSLHTVWHIINEEPLNSNGGTK